MQILPSKILGLPIRTDFRVWVGLPDVAKGQQFIPRVKAWCKRVFVSEQPASLRHAEAAIVDFYLSPYAKLNATNVGTGQEKRTLCFDHDFEMIASAFMKDYGIDLWVNECHYHKFCAMFQNLGDDNRIKQVMSWRGADLSKIKDGQERLDMERRQALYALPLTAEEKAEKAEIETLITRLR